MLLSYKIADYPFSVFAYTPKDVYLFWYFKDMKGFE